MNIKRWFAWACLALMLVAEIFLFLANREKDAALTSLRETQIELSQARAELTELKATNVEAQASEILRLRKQNEILTNQLATLQAALDSLKSENESNSQHLATARLALKLQRQHIEELQNANEQIQQAAESEATNTAAIVRESAEVIAKKTCLNNLRWIDDAKQGWAADNNEPNDAVPTVVDLLPYLHDHVFPVCPSGGTYSINRVDEVPTCSYPGHTLP